MKQKKVEFAAKITRGDDSTSLRNQAEELARKTATPASIGKMSPAQIELTLHELQVHQIELTLQNEELRRSQMELDTARERYFDLFNLAPVAYLTISKQGLITETNLVAANMLGWTRSALVKQPLTRYILKIHQDIYYRQHQQLLKTGKPQTCELLIVKKDNSNVWVLLGATIDEDAHSEPLFRVVLTDITSLKLAEEELRGSELMFRTLFESANDSIFMMDNNIFIECNNKTLQIFGCTKEQILGQSPYRFSPEVQPDGRNSMEKAIEKIDAALKGQPQFFEWKHSRYDGTLFDAEVSLNTYPTENNKYVIQAIVRDITEHKQAIEALRKSEERYHELSIVDSLTTLYNSRHFYVQLKIELERSNRYEQPLTLLLLDLDNFKAFNDIYGHIEGDKVLRRLGYVIKRCLRETDSAYRYGGEEFTILLPMTTSADGAVTAERVLTELKNETFSPAPGQEVHLTASIGIAQYKPKEDMKVFVHRVDQLMYQAKKTGKDRVYPKL